MQWFAQAPSNIALIKYMGKKSTGNNIPINPSLSYTLNNLVSSVMLEKLAGKKDFWEPLDAPGALPFDLSSEAIDRFLQHLARIKTDYKYTGGFMVRSSSNFPHNCGLASSASSFAALTKCAVLALSELTSKPLLSIEEQANLSRKGSGSSCRSFFSPWALWEEESVKAIDLPYNQLIHQVIVISSHAKEVSSSDAHERIKSSLLYPARSNRAKENLKLLLNAFAVRNWGDAFQVCWREFQDLHQLFTTCSQSFTYMTDQTKLALQTLQDFWLREGDGPLVTMDAGPNIHLLYRSDQEEMAHKFKQDYLIGNYDFI